MAVYKKEFSICGLHIYEEVWSLVEGEILDTVRECDNPYNKYSVAVLKENLTLGHIHREISKTVAFFIKHGGVIWCKVQTFCGGWRFRDILRLKGRKWLRLLLQPPLLSVTLP